MKVTLMKKRQPPGSVSPGHGFNVPDGCEWGRLGSRSAELFVPVSLTWRRGSNRLEWVARAGSHDLDNYTHLPT